MEEALGSKLRPMFGMTTVRDEGIARRHIVWEESLAFQFLAVLAAMRALNRLARLSLS